MNDWALAGTRDLRFPVSEEAERALLGCVLFSPEVLDEAQEAITGEHFEDVGRALLWGELCAMRAAGIGIDLASLTVRLHESGQLEKVGGAAALAALMSLMPTAANWPFYRDTLVEKWTLRRVIRTCEEYARRAYAQGEPSAQVLDGLQAEALSIGESRLQGGETIRHLKAGLLEAVDRMEAAYQNRGRPSGLDTGFHDLNRMTSGLHAGQMIILAGRPAMGKTSLGVNIAENVAFGDPEKQRAGLPVAIFSLEMSYVDLAERILCGGAEVDLQRLRDGFLRTGDLDRIMEKANKISAAPLFIDDTPALEVNEFRARARRAVKRHGVRLIVVDYIGLMRSNSKRARDNRQVEMSEISGALKATAKELQIPIIVLAQLNRDAEHRSAGARPRLSDLRESGSLEQDADLVGLLYREEYYNPTPENAGQAELIIAKQRNGPVGSVQLGFRQELTKFTNATERLYSNREDQRQQGYEGNGRGKGSRGPYRPRQKKGPGQFSAGDDVGGAQE